jgi:hypothetical protein
MAVSRVRERRRLRSASIKMQILYNTAGGCISHSCAMRPVRLK